MDNEPTITLPDGASHKIADLSDELKELLAIYETAQMDLTKAKRLVAINEIAATTTANIITQKINEPEEPEGETVINWFGKCILSEIDFPVLPQV